MILWHLCQKWTKIYICQQVNNKSLMKIFVKSNPIIESDQNFFLFFFFNKTEAKYAFGPSVGGYSNSLC